MLYAVIFLLYMFPYNVWLLTVFLVNKMYVFVNLRTIIVPISLCILGVFKAYEVNFTLYSIYFVTLFLKSLTSVKTKEFVYFVFDVESSIPVSYKEPIFKSSFWEVICVSGGSHHAWYQ